MSTFFYRIITMYLLFLVIYSGLSAQNPREVTLPPCTPIYLTLKEEVGKVTRPEKTVALEVKLAVRVADTVLIRPGAFAQAQVRLADPTEARRRRPRLVLVPTMVQAADGSMIHLIGKGLPFGGKGKLSRRSIPVGESIIGEVRYAKKIFLK